MYLPGTPTGKVRSLGRCSTVAFTSGGVVTPGVEDDAVVFDADVLDADGSVLFPSGVVGGFCTSESVRNIPLVCTRRHSFFPVKGSM